jgi:hypothetical protein
MDLDYFNLDPALKLVLMPFAPAVRMQALRSVDAYYKAIDAGDEPLRQALEEAINATTGELAKAQIAIFRVCDTAAVFL